LTDLGLIVPGKPVAASELEPVAASEPVVVAASEPVSASASEPVAASEPVSASASASEPVVVDRHRSYDRTCDLRRLLLRRKAAPRQAPAG